MDFGIAWLEGPGRTHQAKLTRAGAMIGTPAYMAPEQLMGQRVDARTDIYAFGVIVAEMLSGRHPLSVAEAAPAARERTPEDDVLAGLLQRIADHCRQTSPAKRVRTARELVDRLDGMAGVVGAAPGAPRAAKQARRQTRFWWEFHQGAAAVSYVVMLVPAWFARTTIGGVEGRSFFIATTCAAVMASMLRLHLWFTSRQHPAELPWARRRSAAVDPPRRHPGRRVAGDWRRPRGGAVRARRRPARARRRRRRVVHGDRTVHGQGRGPRGGRQGTAGAGSEDPRPRYHRAHPAHPVYLA